MVNSTSTPAPHLLDLYQEIEKAVFKKPGISADCSFLLIHEAVHRLAQAVILKCQLQVGAHPITERVYFEKINPVEVEAINLTTIDDMLDAQFSVDISSRADRQAEFVKSLSIRQALDIAHRNRPVLT